MLDEDGYAFAGRVLPATAIEAITRTLSTLPPDSAGSRDLLSLPWCADLARHLREHPAMSPFLGASFVAVQCTVFEKSAERNWLVPLHQDLSIPVAQRVDHPALSGWSKKEGTIFVQPPDAVLEQLVAVRLHLDPCGAEDGALRVVPGSHRHGRLSQAAVETQRERHGEIMCPVEEGAAFLMKPLLLHASSKATGASRRRVLHFVFGPARLPCGLAWNMAI